MSTISSMKLAMPFARFCRLLSMNASRWPRSATHLMTLRGFGDGSYNRVNHAVQQRIGLLGGTAASEVLAAEPCLGRLLPLRCGHNNVYRDNERQMLLEHLAQEG